MADPPKRPWLQFRLRDAFIAVTVASVVGATVQALGVRYSIHISMGIGALATIWLSPRSFLALSSLSAVGTAVAGLLACFAVFLSAPGNWPMGWLPFASVGIVGVVAGALLGAIAWGLFSAKAALETAAKPAAQRGRLAD
ncbi:MAG: hypothetical protein AB7U73_13575 [Pirellulales bacterium]